LSDDPIEWVRWRIYDSADMGRTIYDSQRIYTQELKLEYDGFLNGRDYKVYLDIQNTVGQTASANALYHVSWQASTTTDIAHATKLNSQSSAIKVSWGGIDYIYPESVTNATIYDGRANIRTAGSVVWSSVNGSSMSLATPWAVAMSTDLVAESASILTITVTGGTKYTVAYNHSSRILSMGYGNNATTTHSIYVGDYDSVPLKIYIDADGISAYALQDSGGLYPSASLHPSDSLFPTETGKAMQSMGTHTVSAAQAAITNIQIGGRQNADFLEVVSDVTAPQKVLMKNWVKVSDDLIPSQVIGTRIKGFSNVSFLADFIDSFDAGTYSIGGIKITGWDVYRKRKSEAFARHLCSLELSEMEFLDYGCGSQMGKYTYFIYPKKAGGTYITNGLQSNTIKPVFWNWSIVEATYDEDNERYNVVNEYIFRNNLSSGSVSNNNNPSVSDNFTQYPTVQMATANYQSGTLTGLIGQVGYTSYVVQYGNSLVDLEERFGTSQQDILDDNGLATWENHGYTGMVIRLVNPEGGVEYFDDKEQRDALWKLSTSTNHLFLKSRIGDVIEIKIAGAISMEIADNTPQQAITGSIPWVQIDDAQDKTIVCGI